MPHDRIESVRITGGYLKGLEIQLADGLNCIIGGTGAGKTTLLELILYALGASVSEARAKEHEALVAHALGDGQVVAGIVTRHGVRYTVSRAVGEAPRVANAEGELVALNLERDLFRVEYRATKEIEALASDARQQLELLDRFVEAELAPVRAEIARLSRELGENAQKLAELDRAIAEDEERAQEVVSITEALRGLAGPAGVDPAVAKKALEDKAHRTRERATIEVALEAAEAWRAQIDKLARGRGLGTFRAEPEALSGPNRDVFATLGQGLAQAGVAEVAAFGGLAAAAESARGLLSHAKTELEIRHARAEEAHRALVAEVDRERGAASERAKLDARLAEATKVARRRDGRLAERAELDQRRAEMLRSLAAQRDTRGVVRDRAVRDINKGLGGRVRIGRKAGADRSAYEALLATLTAGANIRPASFVTAVARDLRPEALAACVAADDIEPLVAIDPAKTSKPERARLLLKTLRASGRVRELEVVGAEDVPVIELATDAGFAPTTHLSTGERCTAILTLVLLQQRGPLVIDEPEQHLHNRFIYSVLVKLLAEAQTKGQLLLATHNANIVVLGDAKRVLSLEAGGGRGWVAEAGTVDELKSAIVILEGGREALKRRTKKYRAGDEAPKGRAADGDP